MALKGVWKRTTRLDRLVVVLVALLCTGSLALFGRAGSGEQVAIIVDGETRFVAGLDRERTVRLAGPIGVTVVSVSESGVRVLDSPCPQKICMGMGSVSRDGELVACVPNSVLIRIEGAAEAQETGYDLLSR